MCKHYCSCCGREIPKHFRKGLCQKHFDQMKMYGEFLDDSQRCETDVNEIVIYDDYAEIVLYDLLFEIFEE